jgi:hypothetical protein
MRGDIIEYKDARHIVLRESDKYVLVMNSDMDCMWIEKDAIKHTGETSAHFLQALDEIKINTWENEGSLTARCSACNCKSQGNTPYCPWCGRRMAWKS